MLGLWILLPAVSVRAQAEATENKVIDPLKKKEIEKLLELTGVTKLMDQMADQMLTAMREQKTADVPEEFWDEFRKQIDTNELLTLLIPVYDRHYSLQDLKVVNAFYSTDVGKRMLATLPQVMTESMAIGQKWGEELGTKVGAQIAARKKEKE